MMKVGLSLLFLIPLIGFGYWWLILMSILWIFFYLLSFNHFFIYFTSLSYSLGMDILSLCMVLLSFWILALMLLASNLVFLGGQFKKEFLLVCLMLLTFLWLTFSSMNLFLFYIFFESSLVPTLFLIFGWGSQPERLSAGFYLLFYTLFASLPLLLGIFYISGTSFTLFYFLINIEVNFYLYISLIMAFLVKMPMVFFHLWLPSAHVEAPISGSMILAGVLLKLGGYGLIRVMNFIGNYSVLYNYIWICISLFGMFLVGLICLSQIDIKSLIAYSSVSHMGLVIGGIFTLNLWGIYGSLVMMIAHGLCSSGLFCLANFGYERTFSRSFYVNKGLLVCMPSMSLFWFLLVSNNMAAPPSLNLVGELFLINSLMGWSSLSMVFLGLSSFLSCCYSIYLYSYTQHGTLFNGVKFFNSGTVREYLLMFFHWFPLNFILLKCDVFLMLI